MNAPDNDESQTLERESNIEIMQNMNIFYYDKNETKNKSTTIKKKWTHAAQLSYGID